MIGAPGISLAINSLPEVCASAINSASSSLTAIRWTCGATQSRFAPRAAADVAGRRRLTRPVEIGHRRRVDHRWNAAGPRGRECDPCYLTATCRRRWGGLSGR